MLSKVFGSSIGTVGHLMHISKMSIRRTARYLFESGVPLRDYTDYLEQCKKLEHCVGGYADRHAPGSTNIFFIRQRSAAHIPYYTIEVSNDFKIVQCRGYRNDSRREKPDEIKEFEKEYEKYLLTLKIRPQKVEKQEVLMGF